MDSIASKPVKCPDCAVWWRGMEHKCVSVTPDYKPKQDKPENWKKEIRRVPEENPHITPKVYYSQPIV